MRVPLALKFGLLAVVPIAVASSVGVYITFQSVRKVLVEHEEVDLKDEAHLRAEWINSQIAMLREDALALSSTAPVRQFVFARERNSTDAPLRAESRLKQEVENLFEQACWLSFGASARSRVPKPYLQIQLITKDGRELACVQRKDNTQGPGEHGVTFAAVDTAGFDSDGDNFVKTSDFPGQKSSTSLVEVFLSKIELSQRLGNRQAGRPVLRASVPLYNDASQFAGAVIVSLDFREIQRELSGTARHLVYLVDDQGRFLVHPNSKKQLGGDKPALIEEQEALKEIHKLCRPEWNDETVRTTGGLERRKLEYLGHKFENHFPPRDLSESFDDEFALAVLERKANDDTNDAKWTKLCEHLQRFKGEISGFRAPPVKVIKDRNSFPISARNEEDLKTLIESLEDNDEFGDVFKEKYRTPCTDFAAHFFRIYHDPKDPDNFLGLVMAFSYEEMDEELWPTRLRIWLQVLLSGALVGTLAVWYSLILTGRLTKIKRASDKIAKGDFDVSLPVHSRDEIGDLGRGFQHMITELQEQGKDLREREARLRMIVDSAAEGIVTAFDRLSAGSDLQGTFPRIPRVADDGVVNRFNLAAKRMFGYEVDELCGESVRRLIAPAYHDQLKSCLHALTGEDSSRPSVTMHAVGVRKDGSQFPLELAVSSGKLDERRMFTFIVRDVTERKEAERRIRQMNEDLTELNAELDQRVQRRTAELERANKELAAARDKARDLAKAKDAFLASVSHELRNPLNQVTGFCQLLELTELDESQRGDLEKIRQAAKRLLTLINDILDYQKIIMGGITLEPEEVPVADLLNEVRIATAFLAEENRNRLEFQTGDDVGTLYADKHRVLQILINLVSNACKFTDGGLVTVHAGRHGDKGQQCIEFSVRDTGRGMKPEERAKLFQPFIKLASKQGNKSGTGLGLVIAKGFCELMGGTITAESEFGKGSTFCIRLPASQQDTLPPGLQTIPVVAPAKPSGRDAAARPARAHAVADNLHDAGRTVKKAVAGAEHDNRTVLVIDDDAGVREMMERYLSTRGFHVVTAEGGLDGLETAKQLKPAAVTLDAIMPGLDGWAVLAALKTDPETQDIPVIMVTISDDEERSRKLGAEKFVSKPIDWERLSSVLAEYTGVKRDRSILVVDDEDETREVLHRFLERDGWKVFEAEDGAAALELLAVEQPAAIILDLTMPGMDGFEFIAEYSQLAEWLSIPVIVLTSKEPDKEELEMLDGLVVRVLRKGDYSTEQLLEEIHRRVDMHIKHESVEITGA